MEGLIGWERSISMDMGEFTFSPDNIMMKSVCRAESVLRLKVVTANGTIVDVEPNRWVIGVT